MGVVKIIAVSIIGFILGLGLWKIGYSGYFQQWEKLPTPPQTVSELIPTGAPPIFIKTLDGKTYLYSDWHNEGWIQQSIPQQLTNPFDVTKPCDFSSPEFSLVSNAPKNIKDCIQVKTMYGDGYGNSAFVIDVDGNIWRWQHIVTPEDIIPMFCFPFLGLSAGLLVAFALKGKKNDKEKS